VQTGGTVHVLAGSYSESVVVDKAVTITGPNAGVLGNAVRGPEALSPPPAAKSLS